MLAERDALSVLMLESSTDSNLARQLEERLKSKFGAVNLVACQSDHFVDLAIKEPFDVVVINADLEKIGGNFLLRQLHLKDEEPLILVVKPKNCSAESAISLLSSGCSALLLSEGAPHIDDLVCQTSSLLRFKRSQQANEEYRAKQSELIRLLTEKNKRLEEFSMTLAHDIRGPLSTISMNLEYILDKFQKVLPEPVTRLITRARSSAGRLTDLVQGMYNYAKLGSQASKKSLLNLEELVKEAASDLQIDSRLDVTVGIGNLPRIWGSKTLIQRVILNLLSNAIKFNDKPHILIDVGVGMSVNTKIGEFATIYIEDNGPGIPEEQREKLFEMFARGSCTEEGLGVGLGVVSRIVELHYGKISVESGSLGGARFTFTLPLNPIQEEYSEEPEIPSYQDESANQ